MIKKLNALLFNPKISLISALKYIISGISHNSNITIKQFRK